MSVPIYSIVNRIPGSRTLKKKITTISTVWDEHDETVLRGSNTNDIKSINRSIR